MSAVTICANAVIRYWHTPAGKKRYNAAIKAGARDYGALLCVARDAVPFLDDASLFDIAAEAQAIKNMEQAQ